MSHSGAGTLYQALPSVRFSPQQVRGRQFKATGLGRRGFDRQDVHRFLALVADDLAAARAEVAQVHEENERIKRALRQWQAEQARSRVR